MKLQTQYGRDADWRDVPASEVPVVAAQWIKNAAVAVDMSERDLVTSLERGDVIELSGKGIEWHDRIRAAK